MRISYWSSDVCSSDLHDLLGGQIAIKLREQVHVDGLVAHRSQYDLDTLGFDQRAVAHRRGRAGQAGHDHVALERLDGTGHIHRVARQRTDLAAQAHRQRSEEPTSELPSLMRNSYAVFCLKKKTRTHTKPT